MYNTHEGENFIPPGLADASNAGSPPYNSSIASFDNWLSGYLPDFSQSDLDKIKQLYPEVGSTETITSYNGTYTRAGLIYRDSVLACPGYWMAGAASKGNYLGEYSISPAKHGSDTGWVCRLRPRCISCTSQMQSHANVVILFRSGTQSAPCSRPSQISTTATQGHLHRSS